MAEYETIFAALLEGPNDLDNEAVKVNDKVEQVQKQQQVEDVSAFGGSFSKNG